MEIHTIGNESFDGQHIMGAPASRITLWIMQSNQ
jgi:hypothetical protein